ncbi:MAG: hypothetical protein ABH879_04875 [archaeon]
MKRVNIGLDDEDHMQAKLISVIKGVPLGEYLQQAVKAYLEKDKNLVKGIAPFKKNG